MSLVLSLYQSSGCVVELESVKSGTPPVWNLNYSRAAKPVVRISRGNQQWWLFYQLHRQGIDRANMPDLALLTGRDPNSSVIWIADPKYSEAAGYTRANYLEVAERYRDAFHPKHVWICEFFSRREWFHGACCMQGDGVSIITEVQPNGEGARLLQRGVNHIHDFLADEFVLAIDGSSSFMDNIPHLETQILLLARCADAVFFFADTAKQMCGGSPISATVLRREVKSVGEGTRLGPLISELERLPVGSRDLILVTDGVFDHSDGLMARLEEMFKRIEEVSDAASLAAIVTQRRKQGSK